MGYFPSLSSSYSYPHRSLSKSELNRAGGQTRNTNLYQSSRFSSSLAIIIAVLVTSIFFMIFFFIYIRYCTSPASAVQRPVVLRATAAVRGLDASVIETFPTFSYSEVKDHQIGKGALECAVCLNEFEDDETLRLIPKCDHVFHPECIDAWLGSHVTCPVCRTDLVPQPGDHPIQIPGSTGVIDEDCDDNNVEVRNSRNDEIVIQIDDENLHSGRRPPRAVNRNLSFQYPNRPPKVVVNRNLSFGNPNRLPNQARNRNMSSNPNHMLRSSPMRPGMFGLGKLGRSRSAGNMLVQPGEDRERFTLRLPSQVRKEVIHQALLNRTISFGTTLGESSRKGKTGVRVEGKIRTDEIGRSDREVKSDRWVFFTRALSMTLRSPRGVAEAGESSGSTSKGVGTRSLNKLKSFNCLEPRAADETGLISEEPVKPTV